MHIVHTIADLRDALSRFKRPAFVPTMGNLHDGHIALVRQAASQSRAMSRSLQGFAFSSLPSPAMTSGSLSIDLSCW